MLKWRLIIRNGRGPLVNRQIKGLRLLLRATVRRWLLLNFIQVRCPRLSCVTRADAEPKLLWSNNCVKPRKNKNTAFVFFFYSSARNRSPAFFFPRVHQFSRNGHRGGDSFFETTATTHPKREAQQLQHPSPQKAGLYNELTCGRAYIYVSPTRNHDYIFRKSRWHSKTVTWLSSDGTITPNIIVLLCSTSTGDLSILLLVK